jgi:hypothetical protein
MNLRPNVSPAVPAAVPAASLDGTQIGRTNGMVSRETHVHHRERRSRTRNLLELGFLAVTAGIALGQRSGSPVHQALGNCGPVSRFRRNGGLPQRVFPQGSHVPNPNPEPQPVPVAGSAWYRGTSMNPNTAEILAAAQPETCRRFSFSRIF